MEGRRFSILTAVQMVSVIILFWLLVTWTGPWNVQRYLGTALAVLGVGFIGLARY